LGKLRAGQIIIAGSITRHLVEPGGTMAFHLEPQQQFSSMRRGDMRTLISAECGNLR